jgi:hypothetical protein
VGADMAKPRLSRVKRKRSGRYRSLKVLCAVTIVVGSSAFCVGGVNSGTSVIRIFYGCLAFTAVVGVVFRMVIKAVESYEEIRRG